MDFNEYDLSRYFSVLYGWYNSVWESEREYLCVCVCFWVRVCVCVCVWERERWGVAVWSNNTFNTFFSFSFPSRTNGGNQDAFILCQEVNPNGGWTYNVSLFLFKHTFSFTIAYYSRISWKILGKFWKIFLQFNLYLGQKFIYKKHDILPYLRMCFEAYQTT